METGQRYKTKFNGELVVLEDLGWDKVVVEFVDTGYKTLCRRSDITTGYVKDNLRPSVFGVGYVGQGINSSKTGLTKSREYQMWQGMLRRGYDKEFKTRRSAYLECGVVEEWHNFQYFCDWLFKQPNFCKYDLDKDLLVKGNKTYSPEFCCLLPSEVNSAITKNDCNRGEYLIGVRPSGNKFTSYLSKDSSLQYLGTFNTQEEAFMKYKLEKELYLKLLAEKYKLSLSEKAYIGLYNYVVDIND